MLALLRIQSVLCFSLHTALIQSESLIISSILCGGANKNPSAERGHREQLKWDDVMEHAARFGSFCCTRTSVNMSLHIRSNEKARVPEIRRAHV